MHSLLDGGLHLLLPLLGLQVQPVVVLRLQLSQVGTLALAQDLGATILEGLQFGLHAPGDCELLLDALLLRLDPLLQELVTSLEEAA